MLVSLRDGAQVEIRPVRPDDEAALERFLDGLSTESRALRFFSAAASMHIAAHLAVDVDFRDTFSLIALKDGEIVGHGMYGLRRPDSVEVGIAVADNWHGRGVGTALVAALAHAAVDNGFETVEAVVLPGNGKMVRVFTHSGVPVEMTSEPGLVHLTSNARSWDAVFH